jgi:hypothetical protein
MFGHFRGGVVGRDQMDERREGAILQLHTEPNYNGLEAIRPITVSTMTVQFSDARKLEDHQANELRSEKDEPFLCFSDARKQASSPSYDLRQNM